MSDKMDGASSISLSYHEFSKAQLQGGALTNPAWILCDAKAIAKYGLGMVRLGGDDLRPYLQDGYLHSGNTLDELANKMGVDAANLRASVEQINAAAESGEDPVFGRGSTVYQRVNGDAEHPGRNQPWVRWPRHRFMPSNCIRRILVPPRAADR
ncbi:MAG: FAD-binding protein [Thiolinea sp.]